LESFWDKSGKKKIDEVADAAKKIRLADVKQVKKVNPEAVYLKLIADL